MFNSRTFLFAASSITVLLVCSHTCESKSPHWPMCLHQ